MFAYRGRVRPTKAVLTAVLVAGALLVAACGGSDSSSESNAPGTDGGGSGELTTVRMANFGYLPSTLPFDYAYSSGLFQENGVDVKLNPPIYNAADAINTLVTGDADMAFVGATAVVAAADAGRDVVLVGTVSSGFPLEVALTTAAMEKLAAQGITAESPIEARVEALKGLTLAGPGAGSTTDLVMRKTIESYGIDPNNDVKLQPLADQAAIVAAARESRVDGIVATTGGPTSLAAGEGFAEIFINFGEVNEELSNTPLHVMATSRSFLEKNPEAVRGVLTAMQESRKAVVAGLTAEELAEQKEISSPDMDEALYLQITEDFTPLWDGPITFTEEQFDLTLAIHNAGADTPATVTFEDVVDTAPSQGI